MIITLTTDFGTSDPYVGIMKGVILSTNPSAMMVDITHDIPPQDVTAAAYALYSSFRYFPEGSIHVVVVDPGVGTRRLILAAQIAGHYFLAPDNGVLGPVLASKKADVIITVENDNYFLTPVSRTFHGRDIFAPVAGHLSKGLPIDRLGTEIKQDRVRSLDLSMPVQSSANEITGTVIAVDRFGNLITNIGLQFLEMAFGGISPNHLIFKIAGHRIIGLSDCYGDVAPASLTALVGSTGFIEIAVNGGSALNVCGASKESSVTVAADILSEIPEKA